MEDQELTGLLYRADWTGLTLSGTVRGAGPIVDTAFTAPGPPASPPSPPPWFFEPSDEGASRALFVAPGRRFRVASADGSRVLGCDGERVWQSLRDMPADVDVAFSGRPLAPFRMLLVPSWLLVEYSLTISGPESVGGRAGVRVLGTPRQALERPRRYRRHAGPWMAGGVPINAPLRWLTARPWDEVDAVVDAELGILLRCSRRRGDRQPSVTEFTALTVGEATSAELFSPPPGSVFGKPSPDGPREQPAGWDALGETLGSAGKEAAKTVAGMAAGGLGAIIRHAPSTPRADPFAQATAEEPDAEASMPADEADPDAVTGTAAPAVPDAVLHLLYSSGTGQPSFTGTLHDWFDFAALIDAIPREARGTGFGGVGFLLDAIRDSAADAGTNDWHSVTNVAMGGWTEYRLDPVRRPAPVTSPREFRSGRSRKAADLVTIASDGTRCWQVCTGRVLTGPAKPPPGDLGGLVDPSWLLDCELSGGAEVSVDGRPGYRVVARYQDTPEAGTNERLERLFFPAVAVVDAETGRLLRLTRFKGGRPVLRQELRDIGPLPPDADFAFTPPPGVPVVEPDADVDEDSNADEWSSSAEEAVRDPAREAADAIRKGVDETVAAARNVWDSFFGGGQRS